MIKKLLPITLIVLLIAPRWAFAFEIYENTNQSVWENPSYNSSLDRYVSDFNKTVVSKVVLTSYETSSYTAATKVKEIEVPSTAANFQFGCNTNYKLETYNSSGNLLSTLRFEATQIKAPDQVECSSGESGGGSGSGSSGECDMCELFSCPGWNGYMGKLNEIKSAIPPAPNWEVVAQIFTDSIAPQIKKDLQSVIGVAPTPTLPTLPSATKQPAKPNQIPIDNFNLPPPEGKEAPGLSDAGFTANKIKDEAAVIEVREDPTGGFNIVDPINSLPTQEEFTKNVPVEGVVSLPADPEEQENKAPSPKDTTDAAPSPKDTADTAPVPDGNFGTMPVPSDYFGTMPVPGGDSSKAPIPGDNSQFSAPIP